MQLARRSAHFLARHRRARWNRAIAKVCRSYLNGFDNLDYDGATNGENALIERMACPSGTVLLDVGANIGLWTEAVRSSHPGSVVHAFEIDPTVADQLASRFADDPAVTVVGAGLSAQPGVGLLHVRATTSRGSSIVAPLAVAGEAATTTKEVELLDGDGYLVAAGIEHVRYLKIDTEGNDLNVLRGFAGALAAGRIDALQFEHNESSIPAGVHLKDVYDLLEPLGFEIGRLFPDCVLFRPWRSTYEREGAGNHVAVRRDLPDLRAQLAGSAA